MILYPAVCSVLLVEDDDSFRNILSLMLRRLGIAFVTAVDNVEEALDAIQLIDFDLIVSDWNMEPLDGLQFLEILRVRKSRKDIPFLMITADSSIEYWRKAIAGGANEFLRKPFNQSQLIEAIHIAIDVNHHATKNLLIIPQRNDSL